MLKVQESNKGNVYVELIMRNVCTYVYKYEEE